MATVETDAAGSAETRYTWCEGRICLASDSNGQPLAGYFEEGAFYPQGAPAGALTGRREYYARDHLGSVRDVLDENGHVTARYDYDPYGGWLTPPAPAPHAGYAGMDYHAPSGLYLTHYRAYDPETGRWLSRDPIEEAGGINLYAYVEGDPVNWVDPEGLARGRNTVETHFWKNIINGKFEEASLSSPYLERKFIEQCIKDRGNDIVKALKEAGKGAGARSGQHGTPYKQAGNKIIQEGNKIGGELGEIFRNVGRQMQEYGRGINHY